MKNRVTLVGKYCYSCGVDAEDLDEFPKEGMSGVYIPCCNECKKLGGSKFGDDIFQKANFIQERLNRKYDRQLRTPEWSDDEIAELSDKFAKEFQGFSRLSRSVRIRCSWNYTKYLQQLDIENDPHEILILLGIEEEDRPYWWRVIFPGY